MLEAYILLGNFHLRYLFLSKKIENATVVNVRYIQLAFVKKLCWKYVKCLNLMDTKILILMEYNDCEWEQNNQRTNQATHFELFSFNHRSAACDFNMIRLKVTLFDKFIIDKFMKGLLLSKLLEQGHLHSIKGPWPCPKRHPPCYVQHARVRRNSLLLILENN